MRDRVVVALNLLTLLVGLFAGFALGRSSHATASAQESPTPPPQESTPAYEEIAPVVTAGSAAFGVLLSGRLATDEITVKGVDIVKLQENLLNLLSTKSAFTTAELQRVIDNAKVPRPLRMKQPTAGRGGQR